MSYNNTHRVPSVWERIYSVWYRHEKVYNAYLVSNSFPSILEPLIMLAALGFGLGGFIPDFNGISYLLFLASGLPVTTAMFTSAYECTYGTFVRLEYDKVYDGILGAPISPTDLLLGELLFAGTKGFLFSLAVLAVGWVTQIITYPLSIAAAGAGFLCGVMFASLSMVITSFVKNMNHFNFYFTGILSPMFFFSGAVFPLDNMPTSIIYLAEVLPLTHVVRMSRAFCLPGGISAELGYDLLYVLIFSVVMTYFAIKRLKKRLIV